jgi:hypothetical protein
MPLQIIMRCGGRSLLIMEGLSKLPLGTPKSMNVSTSRKDMFQNYQGEFGNHKEMWMSGLDNIIHDQYVRSNVRTWLSYTYSSSWMVLRTKFNRKLTQIRWDKYRSRELIWPRPFWRPWFWAGKKQKSRLVAPSRQNSIFGPIHSQSGPIHSPNSCVGQYLFKKI